MSGKIDFTTYVGTVASGHTGTIAARKFGDMVFVKLSNITGISSSQSSIGTLPEEARPSVNTPIITSAQRSDNYTWVRFAVLFQTNGAIVPLDAPTGLISVNLSGFYIQ